MASPGSVRVRLPAALAATAATVLAGCATMPSGGAPQLVTTGGNQVQAYGELLPPPGPEPGWKPSQVVLGFLHASASYAVDPEAARQFLVPALREGAAAWRPSGPVTVVSSINNARPPKPNSRLEPTYTAGEETVKFTGQRLATLSPAGQYEYSPGKRSYEFQLRQVGGDWLISQLPGADQDSLLLLQWDFEHVYQARNLFFFARHPALVNGELVPDPVYAPLQSSDSALNTNLAYRLVKEGLLEDQASWLSGATKTAFPHGTTLLGVAITGQTAVVNLGGAAVHANEAQRQDMEQQLRATLGSTAYSAALARSVVLEIDGRRAYMPSTLPDLIHDVQGGPLAFLSREGTVREGFKSGQQVAGPEQFGLPDITALATAPDGTRAGQVAVAAQDRGGCQVYMPPEGGGPGPDISRTLSTSGGECTSLSWDNNGNLWAAAGRNIWVLRAPAYQKQLVSAPVNPTSGRGPVILSLRMAPDAVRAALLIKTGRKARLVLAAVNEEDDQLSLGNTVNVGTGLPDPIAMSWYNPYDLVVLDKSGIAEVPLTGGPGQQIEPVPSGAQSLTTNGTTLAVGTDSNGKQQIWTASALGAPWYPRQAGSLPVYPG